MFLLLKPIKNIQRFLGLMKENVLIYINSINILYNYIIITKFTFVSLKIVGNKQGYLLNSLNHITNIN